MNKENRLQKAAEIIANCRRNGTSLPMLPAGARPETVDEAYDVQKRVAHLLNAAPSCWKVSASGPSGPTAAPVFGDRILHSPATAEGVTFLEAEIALKLRRDLPSAPPVPYSRDAILDAIDAFAVAFEIVAYRLTSPDLPFPQRLADCLANDGLVIGTQRPVCSRLDDPVKHLSLYRNDVLEAFEPIHIDPINALMAYANYGSGHIGGLKAGHWVLTGSMVGIIYVTSAAKWKAEWNGKSTVSLSI
jgi:2-keto-4-pentenoate hydratase